MAEYIRRKFTATRARFGAWRGKVLALLAAFFWMAVLIAWAVDTDSDGMSDEYENLFRLDPTNAADAALNYDDDSLVNSNEAAVSTDPWQGDTDRDGFKDDADDQPLSRAWIQWGDTNYTFGDDYEYTGPAWWLDAYKVGGEWSNSSWHVAASAGNPAQINIGISTDDLSSLVMRLDFFDHAGSSLFAGYYDTNGYFVDSNLFGNVMQGSESWATLYMCLDISNYTGVAGVSLYRGTGELTISNSLLYVDADLDGLDADQESQEGSSDSSADSDEDGLGDYAEVFTYGSDPTNPDSDNDGMQDGLEVYHGQNPASSNSYSALPFTEYFETNTCTVGDLNGQHGWTASPANTALVQTQVVYEGAQALQLSSSGQLSVVRSLFAAPAANTVWLDMYAKAIAATTPSGAVTDSAVFLFNTQGRLVVRDGTSWLTLSNVAAVATGSWVRISVKLDYSSQTWQIVLNGTNAAENLDFAASGSAFSAFSIEAKTAYSDSIKLDTSMPADLDLDQDTLPDYWELQYFGNLNQTASGNYDGDGLTNLEEYQQGTNPTAQDSDSDGMSDSLEIFHGQSPTSSNTYSTIPFIENFETNTCTVGDLNGQHGWTAAPIGTALVQTQVVYQGTQALQVSGFTSQVSTVRNLFAAPASSTVWFETYAKVIAAAAPTGTITDTAVFYFNSSGQLVVLDGATWRTVTVVSATTGTWARITVKLDYSAQEWAIFLNGVIATDHVAFAESTPEFSSLAVDAEQAYLDALSLDTATPGNLSFDDHLPDSWEIQYFGSITLYGDSDDPDGDGVSNLAEYQAATNPADLDNDDDGLSNWYEANVSGTGMNDSDSDDDGLNDGWEVRYGLNPLSADSSSADPDSDGWTNAQEASAGTNPFLADSDGDGAEDDVDGNPLLADQGDSGGPPLTVISPTQGENILW